MLFKNDRIKATSEYFDNAGGKFITPPVTIAKKLKSIKAFIFDWDGVFNSGIKTKEQSSGFGEADAMGLHILRYAYWRKTGQVPVTAIITGQKNESAITFAQREHINEVFTNFKDKAEPVKQIADTYQIKKNEIASVFDDIIDYPLADNTGLRFLINRDASPLFRKYFTEHNLCDYVTGMQQAHFPVREICEMVVAFIDHYDEMLISRFKNKKQYQQYAEAKNSINTNIVEGKT